MLKLPAILWGCGLLIWGGIWGNLWLVAAGSLVLGLGVFFFTPDFGTGGSERAAEDQEDSDD